MSNMTKLIFTYLVVLIVVVGGFLVLYFASGLDDLVRGAIIGFIGMALNFTFGAEVQSRTAIQQERALFTTPNGQIETTTSGQPVRDPATGQFVKKE